MGELFNSFIKCLFGAQAQSQRSERERVMEKRARREVGNSSPSLRKTRLQNEIMMIAPRFSNTGGVNYDVENCDWIIIPQYPLPERWQDRWCSLLIVPPSAYPNTPPIGFYLNRKFHLKNGGTDNHFTGQAHYGAPDLQAQGWFWYCVHMNKGSQGGWQPSADYRQPDNLWTFLNMVRESLTNDF